MRWVFCCLILTGCNRAPAPIVAPTLPTAAPPLPAPPPVEPFEIHGLAPAKTNLDEFRKRFPGAVISDSVRFSLIPEVSELNYRLSPGPTPELTIADRWITGISATFLNSTPVEIVITLDPAGARSSVVQALTAKFGRAAGRVSNDPAGLTWVRQDSEHHYVLSLSNGLIHLSDQSALQKLQDRKTAAANDAFKPKHSSLSGLQPTEFVGDERMIPTPQQSNPRYAPPADF
jgi:hypothetical protein